ncbi:hypothetical protein LTR37_010035 [Vermiconidia calcicola]|uniref:Uncharacterized protein n=1 Tax=Vermiconidia calcicola TaxID=1690605 RepID=A0ACC3N6J4_9PEZI|nr:hypothetical protein LTR37_010035 [Vermiconidia calcicola]
MSAREICNSTIVRELKRRPRHFRSTSKRNARALKSRESFQAHNTPTTPPSTPQRIMYTHPMDDPGDGIPRPKPGRNERRNTIYNTGRQGRPRWILHMQAVFWRVLMGLGMFFHRLAPPRPPKPDFSRIIPSTISGKPGNIELNFYVPKDYGSQRKLWTNREGLGDAEELLGEEGEETTRGGGDKSRRRSSMSLSEMGRNFRRSTSARKWGGYPVVINFHGGGFTLGSPADDARWCGTAVDECHAVVISVDYRLAPECPFPTAVEDGVDAVIYVHNHATELGIDSDKIALSGFSSGANMCFTVPLRLYDETQGFPRDPLPSTAPTSRQQAERAIHGSASENSIAEHSPSSSNASTKVATPTNSSGAHITILDPNNNPAPEMPTPNSKTNTIETIHESTPSNKIPSDVKIACIIPWYPPVDYTRTREQRRATCARADQELPALFTDLFDDSYLHPPDTISLDSPYLSPGVAPTELLAAALPQEIIMHTCEWDMLLAEGIDFRDRLTDPAIGINKNVFYKMVEGVPHGWDKAPNPLKPTPGVREYYLGACKEMRRVFGPEMVPDGSSKKRVARPVVERATTKGWPSAAPRGSVQVVR